MHTCKYYYKYNVFPDFQYRNRSGSNTSSWHPLVEATIDLLLVNKLPDVNGESIVFLTTSREPTLHRHTPLSPQSRYFSPLTTRIYKIKFGIKIKFSLFLCCFFAIVLINMYEYIYRHKRWAYSEKPSCTLHYLVVH